MCWPMTIHVTCWLQEHKVTLGIIDVQLRLTPLEEVFTAVASQAEVLQHAPQTNEAP